MLSRILLEYDLSSHSTQCKSMSNIIYLDSGIGEGSMLGPMCFVTRLMDVIVLAEIITRRRLKGIEAKVYIMNYADDVSTLFVGDNEVILQRSTDIISEEVFNYFSSVIF